jgi:hypothetical protein
MKMASRKDDEELAKLRTAMVDLVKDCQADDG